MSENNFFDNHVMFQGIGFGSKSKDDAVATKMRNATKKHYAVQNKEQHEIDVIKRLSDQLKGIVTHKQCQKIANRLHDIAVSDPEDSVTEDVAVITKSYYVFNVAQEYSTLHSIYKSGFGDTDFRHTLYKQIRKIYRECIAHDIDPDSFWISSVADSDTDDNAGRVYYVPVSAVDLKMIIRELLD